VLMLAAGSIPAVVVAGLVAGAFQGPMLLTLFGVIGAVVPHGRGGIVMTLTSSAVVTGIAVGSALAGAVAQTVGATGGFAIVVAAALALLLLGALSAPALRRVRRA
jgi:MFS family permease